MPYTLELAPERQLVTIRRYGVVTYQEIKDSLGEIYREVESDNRPHLLVDVRAATRYPEKADLMLAADTRCRELHLSRRTAFVTNGEAYESIKFLVLAALNRGYSVQLFTEETRAIDWLFDSSQSL